MAAVLSLFRAQGYYYGMKLGAHGGGRLNWRTVRRTSLTVLQDYAFGKGVLTVTALVSVIAACSYLADLATGVSCAVGVFLVSICDLPGNKLEHLTNMVCGLLLAVFNLIIVQLVQAHPYLNLLVLPVLIFGSAYVSVFGKRASLISFSGLLAIVLAYAFPKTGWAIAYGGLYVFLGGGWFILLNVLVHGYRYRRYRVGLLNRMLKETAAYLELKSRQLTAADPDALWPDLIVHHNGINEIRKVLTDYFLGQSPGRDNIGRQTREGVLYLELVDLVELAAAVPVRAEGQEAGTAEITHQLAGILTDAADALRNVARKSRNFRSATPDELQARLLELARHLRTAAPDLPQPQQHYAYILYDNLDKQLTKLRSIEHLADARGEMQHAVYTRAAKERLRGAGWADLAEARRNFSTDSATFRHCLRLATAVVAGYLAGKLLGVHNAYWILLTVVVILRPTYVQSKERSVQRTVGTVAGALVAAALVSLTDNHVVYAGIGILAMPFVFTFMERDYRISAFFVTLNLVFTYALLHPDAYAVIGYRVIDTVIGAALAFAASRLLWPAWDRRFIHRLLGEALESSGAYLRGESDLYAGERGDGLSFRIARRQAFICLGELDASYARALQEPGGADVSRERLRRVVTQLHRVLSAIAYLGTYLQYHAVNVPERHVAALTEALADRLLWCRDVATGGTAPRPKPTDTAPARAYFDGPPEVEAPVEQLQQKRLFREEYHYLSGLIDELEAGVTDYARG